MGTILPSSTVNYHFGSLGRALEVAGLRVMDPAGHFRNRGPTLSEDDLFASLSKVELQVGHEHTSSEYNADGAFSTKPFRDRFGKWDEVLVHYRKRWKAEHPGGVGSVGNARQDWTGQPPAIHSSGEARRVQTDRTFGFG